MTPEFGDEHAAIDVQACEAFIMLARKAWNITLTDPIDLGQLAIAQYALDQEKK